MGIVPTVGWKEDCDDILTGFLKVCLVLRNIKFFRRHVSRGIWNFGTLSARMRDLALKYILLELNVRLN